MKNNIHSLQNILHSNTLGLIWMTESPLKEKPGPFKSLNYFWDGLLLQNITQNNHREDKNVFISNHFGSPVFLGHILKTSEDQTNKVDEILSIGLSLNNDSNLIYLIGEFDKNLIGKLKKKYPNLEFQPLAL